MFKQTQLGAAYHIYIIFCQIWGGGVLDSISVPIFVVVDLMVLFGSYLRVLFGSYLGPIWGSYLGIIWWSYLRSYLGLIWVLFRGSYLSPIRGSYLGSNSISVPILGWSQHWWLVAVVGDGGRGWPALTTASQSTNNPSRGSVWDIPDLRHFCQFGPFSGEFCPFSGYFAHVLGWFLCLCNIWYRLSPKPTC